MAGPIEFSGSEIAVVVALFGLVPPFFIALVGSLAHALVMARSGREAVVWTLFLKWWLWCTLGWVAAWFLGILFS